MAQQEHGAVPVILAPPHVSSKIQCGNSRLAPTKSWECGRK